MRILHRGRTRSSFLLLASISMNLGMVDRAWAYRLADVSMILPDNPSPRVRLAADEIRRYVFLLTSTLPPALPHHAEGRVSIILRCGPGDAVPTNGPDPAQCYALYAEKSQQVVHGASDTSILWAAYHLVESWGVGFYLGGDALPKPDPQKSVELTETKCTPALAIRGNLPWFNFLNSPTTWNPQDYKSFFSQMAKQRANFIGFHAYDHEPFCAYDVTPKDAKMGGPLMTTISPHRWWSPPAMSTKDFLFGTGLFFERGEWGCDVGIEDGWTYAPGRATQLQQLMMADALAYAKRVGLKTCIGFEVTGNPEDPAVREAFEKRLVNVLTLYPLDYFWVWQSEGRGTAGAGGNWVAGAPNDPSMGVADDVKKAFAYLGPQHDLREAARITKYVRLAHDVLKEKAPKVALIVSGWGGDAHMKFSTLYLGLDKVVPPDVIFAALDNIDPRLQDHVSDVYGKLSPERQRWPIPWFESDGGQTRMDQTGPQTNVTAFEPLLKDIVKKGCQGALGIHWRTRNVEDVAGYLYRFGWDEQLTAAKFFSQYARENYGPADAEEMAKVHLRLEELGPCYVGAVGCVECSTGFQWFVKAGGADLGREPNRAGHLPNVSRFSELETLADDLTRRAETAATEKRDHAAVAYHDLAQIMRWLVIRARVGLEIWDEKLPLVRRLRDAEMLYENGHVDSARGTASAIASELQSLDFQRALQALATTCRTRGELGMLATANARYGRYYAAFVRRLEHILDQRIDALTKTTRWDGDRTRIIMPVPAHVAIGETVSFDGIFVPANSSFSRDPKGSASADPSAVTAHAYQVAVRRVQADPSPATLIPMQIIGGACHRAVFQPTVSGVYQWSVTSSAQPAIIVATGAFTVTPKVSGAPAVAAK